jgi:hypothetical protein
VPFERSAVLSQAGGGNEVTIKEIEPRLQEIGRLRTGTTTKRGRKTIPVSLETWRLTSAHLEPLHTAARIFGGEVQPWSDGHGSQYELVTETDRVAVLVPPQDLERGQYLELYSGGGIRRRCDGETELISGESCICSTEGDRQCSPTTHLRVILPQLDGIGTWRCTTTSWNAAAELAGQMQIIDRIRERQMDPLVAAELVMEQRQSKVQGETHNYVVPVLHVPYTLAELGMAERPALQASAPGMVAAGEPGTGTTSPLETPGVDPSEEGSSSRRSADPASSGHAVAGSPPVDEPPSSEDSADASPADDASDSRPEGSSSPPVDGSTKHSGRRRGCKHLKGSHIITLADGRVYDACVECEMALGPAREIA